MLLLSPIEDIALRAAQKLHAVKRFMVTYWSTFDCLFLHVLLELCGHGVTLSFFGMLSLVAQFIPAKLWLKNLPLRC